jgi:hypothetical protein
MELFKRLTILSKALLIVVLLGLLAGGSVLATSLSWPAKTIIGSANITVPIPETIDAVYNFTVSDPTVDFSGSTVTGGGAYSKNASVTINNTGTNGANPFVSAKINSITASATGLPPGWTIIGSTGEILVGSSATLTINLSNPSVTHDTVLLPFTINLVAN